MSQYNTTSRVELQTEMPLDLEFEAPPPFVRWRRSSCPKSRQTVRPDWACGQTAVTAHGIWGPGSQIDAGYAMDSSESVGFVHPDLKTRQAGYLMVVHAERRRASACCRP